MCRQANTRVETRDTGPSARPGGKRWSARSFLLGVLAGILAPDLLSALPKRDSRRFGVIDELVQVLGLTAAQRTQIEQIIAEMRRRYADTEYKRQQLKDDSRLAEIRHATRLCIRALLDAEQDALFTEWVRQRDARRGDPNPMDGAETSLASRNKDQPLAA